MSLMIDYITMPPKSQEASQIQTAEIAKTEHENMDIAQQFQDHVRRYSEQTVRRNRAENEYLRNEEKKQNDREKQGKKKQNKANSSSLEEENKKEKNSKEKSEHFDLRI